jgi:cell division protein FtsL
MNNNKVNHYNKTYYVEGNVARNMQAVPDYQVEELPSRREQPKRREQRRTRVNTGMDAFSFLFFAIAVTVTLYTCIEYLSVQSNITQMEKEVVTLEGDLMKLKNENRAAVSQINTSLDLNYIYKVATKQLGMVYPDGNQVITYKSTVSDYVRQYADIPEESKTTLLGKITN